MEQHSFGLSKLDISGPLDEDTPIVVLAEIAEAFDIPCEIDLDAGELIPPHVNIITSIAARSNKFVFHYPLKQSEVIIATHLINRNVPWDIQTLQRAMNFTFLFVRSPTVPSVKNFVYGQALPTNPESFCACMLYRLLRINGIATNKELTLEQMASTVMVLYDKTEHMRNVLFADLLADLRNTELAKMYIVGTDMLKKRSRDTECEEYDNDDDEDKIGRRRVDENEGEEDEEEYDLEIDADALEDANANVYTGMVPVETLILPSPPISYWETSRDALDQSLIFFESIHDIRRKVIPRNHVEAVILACLCYNIDISLAESPLAEYEHLRFTIDPNGVYTPADKYLRELTKIAPAILRLDTFFNPLVPQNMYESVDLRAMAAAEGFAEADFILESYYSLLQSAYFSDTFYHGFYPYGMTNEMTLTFETVSEVHPTRLVCYGNRGTNNMYAFLYDELAMHFTKSKSFLNPVDGTMFSGLSIKKLKMICRLIYPDDSEASIAERTRLKTAINHVEILTKETSDAIREIYKIRLASEEFKIRIDKAILSFFRLGMFMRGWDGEAALPIERAPVFDQVLVDIRVNTEIHIFESELEILGENLKTLILSIPLVRYVEGEYIPSNNIEEGLTIGDRLKIVKMGDNDEVQESCIRLSSNWLCSTAFRIMEILEIPGVNFDIAKLRYIS